MALTSKPFVDALFKHPLIALGVAAAIFFGAIFLGAGAITAIRYKLEDRKVEELEKKADEAVKQENQQKSEAAKAEQERAIEDAIRERTIKPEIQRTTRNLEDARTRTRDARNAYDKTQKSTPGPDTDARALHERNCSDLRELYPDEPIPGCSR